MTRFLKISVLLVVLTMIFSTVPCLTALADDAKVKENAEFIENGSFEKVTKGGAAIGWSVLDEGGEVSVSTKSPKDGQNCMKLTAPFDVPEVRISQTLLNTIGGETYTLTFSMKTMKAPGQAMFLKMECYNSLPTGDRTLTGEKWQTINYSRIGKWQDFQYDITIPEETNYIGFMLRLYKGGEVYLDNVSFVGKQTIPEVTEADMSIVPPGAENLVKNSSFEEADATGIGAEGWAAYKNFSADNPFVSVLSGEQGYESDKAIKVETESGGNPWVRCQVPIDEGAQYVFVARYKTEYMLSGHVAFKVEFYNNDTIATETRVPGEHDSSEFPSTGGDWIRVNHTFEAPPGAKMAAIYLRLYGNGSVLFDDAEMYFVKTASNFKLNTDWVFYYSDVNDGTATAIQSKDTAYYSDKSVGFRLLDGEKILKEQKPESFSGGDVKFRYAMSLLSEKQKEYTVEATMYDSGGNVLESLTASIYKYDRPTYLREDGVYLKDGEPFYPVFGYHVSKADYPRLKEAGINVVQCSFPSLASLDEYLALAKEYNVMLLINLYPLMQPAGSPANAERTRTIVSKYKDNPNIFAWIICDEPFYNNPYNLAITWLEDSYKLIRDLDPDRPTYLVENLQSYYGESAKYCDILAIDPYPGKVHPATEYVSDCVKLAQDACSYGRVIYPILQAIDWIDGYWPSGDETRNMVYQSFFEGTKAVGYFGIEDARTDADGKKIPIYTNEEDWKPYVQLAESDYAFAFEAFVSKTLADFNEGRGEDVWYRSFVKNNAIYMVVLNRKNDRDVTASIPLTSNDGTISVNGYTCTALSGGNGDFSGSNTLDITLSKAQAVLYKITPTDGTDLRSLTPNHYIDTAEYPWARTEIETLHGQGIVNSIAPEAYGPAKPITRADFAMFLVRTLGLQSYGGDTFADVSKDAYYAREISIGKELGILKGMGDGNFNPEAPISRQDLMVISARGMRLVKELASADDATLRAFVDGDSISDYATADVGAMVQTGIVKGNADGTINPLGNTTRAEAAVIMSRILSWK